jgi:D-galactarolactone isomerase
VAVVSETTPEAEIDRLTRAGIAGQRFFQLQWGAVRFERMHDVMARVHPHGWFANLQLDGRELPAWEASIKRLPGNFVVDHIGKFLEPVSVDSAPFKSLLSLLDTGRCWVKLAAAYETSKTGAPAYEDVSKLARALVKHAPERMIWASNWPHPSAPKDKAPDDADLLDLLLDWAPDETIRKQILVDNPVALYGF